jgi:hypothetical protein
MLYYNESLLKIAEETAQIFERYIEFNFHGKEDSRLFDNDDKYIVGIDNF